MNTENPVIDVNKKVTIDVDLVIEMYNTANPDKKQLTRGLLAEKLGVHTQILSDWNRGKTPNIIPKIMLLAEISGAPIDKFIKQE